MAAPGEKPPFWNHEWDFISQVLPDFPEAFFDFAIQGLDGSLDKKTLELVLMASDATPSHFLASGFRFHGREAARHGATMSEIVGVLAVISSIGMLSYLLGNSILSEESSAAVGSSTSPEVADLRRRHVALFGTPLPEADQAMHANPAFYERWLNFATVCLGPECALTPKVAHLVGIAASAQCTLLAATGVRQHVRGALTAGATAGEVQHVFEAISGLGGHAMMMGIPHVLEEFGLGGAAET